MSRFVIVALVAALVALAGCSDKKSDPKTNNNGGVQLKERPLPGNPSGGGGQQPQQPQKGQPGSGAGVQ